MGYAYVCDDGVAIVSSHKVLDSTWTGICKFVTTDEVVCELVLCCVGGCAVHDGHSAICLDAIPVAIDFGHRAGICCSLQTSGREIVASSVLERSTREREMCFRQIFREIRFPVGLDEIYRGRLNVQETDSGCFGGRVLK